MSNAIGDLVEENYKLKEEIERLQDRIDKAIEYIKSTKYEWGDLDQDNEDYDIDANELLRILKGE